jgi:hypothetical protein
VGAGVNVGPSVDSGGMVGVLTGTMGVLVALGVSVVVAVGKARVGSGEVVAAARLAAAVGVSVSATCTPPPPPAPLAAAVSMGSGVGVGVGLTHASALSNKRIIAHPARMPRLPSPPLRYPAKIIALARAADQRAHDFGQPKNTAATARRCRSVRLDLSDTTGVIIHVSVGGPA